MQLLKLQLQVVKIIVVCGCAAHVIGVFLERNGAVISGAGVPGRDKATLFGAGLVGGGALIVRMVNGEAPVANLSQRTIVLIMARGLFVAVKAVGIRGRGLFTLALGARERTNTALADCMALHTVSTFSWGVTATKCAVTSRLGV